MQIKTKVCTEESTGDKANTLNVADPGWVLDPERAYPSEPTKGGPKDPSVLQRVLKNLQH